MVMMFFDNLPKWLLLVSGLLFVFLFGMVDRVTGDYSMFMLYTVPIFFVAWFAGRCRGIITSLAAGFASFFSNLHGHHIPLVDYWNSSQDMLFFIIIGLLVAQLRKALE